VPHGTFNIQDFSFLVWVTLVTLAMFFVVFATH